MKSAVCILFLLLNGISEIKGLRRCKKPMGISGETILKGCLRQTCRQGVWKYSLDDTVCCFENKPFKVKTTIVTKTTDDGCTTSSVECQPDGKKAKMVFQVKQNCLKYSTESQVDEIKQLLEQHILKTDQLNMCILSNTSTATPTFTTTTSTSTTVETESATAAETTSTTTKPMTSHTTSTTITPPTSHTTSTTTATNIMAASAILIVGGGPSELFIPRTNKSCSFPSPTNYDTEMQTLDTVNNKPILCGGHEGWWENDGCLHFTPTNASGEWKPFSTMEKRFGHSSWVSKAGIVLMGGYSDYDKYYYSSNFYGDGTTTEIVPSGGRNFSLLQNTAAACAIQDYESTIITGGSETEDVVARYNLQGFQSYLPYLNQGRGNHGCGSYLNNEKLVLVVAGGYVSLSLSTEKLTIGDAAWTFGNPLPRTLWGVATVSLDNKVFLTGGSVDMKNWSKEILVFDGESWEQIGEMKSGRGFHAATKIDIDHTMGFCD